MDVCHKMLFERFIWLEVDRVTTWLRLPWVSVFRIGGIGLGSKRWRDGVDIWVLDV